MACTSQSAEGYIRSARRHLVEELNNLSVIVENLYQQEVLCDEEVSKIQAEKDNYDKRRKILDSVLKKGEQACYELLKIIDMTRKRTLERPPPHPGTKTFDLNYWISCFSFKDDAHTTDANYLQGPRPCHRYQEKLKSKAKKISHDFWAASKNLFEANKKPDLSYISLVLDTERPVSSKIKKLKTKKSKLSRPKKLKKYIPEEKPDISPSELLKTDKNVLLVGKPGIGKSALTHEMLRLWAERESKELDYMFYFDKRKTSHIRNAKSFEELLFSLFSEPDEGKDEVLQDIKRYSDKVTIIFDGITDLSSPVVEELLQKDLLPLAKIIITCRPDDEDEDIFSDFMRVEVKGFSEQTIKTYLSSTLSEDQKVFSNLELLTLCHVPMYAMMMVACFKSEGSPQPCTITEIYINIVRFCLQINSETKKQKDLNWFISTKKEEILSLAEAAFLSTEQKTVNVKERPCEDSCVLSFLKPLLIKEALTETRTTYAFLHYTVQEFFAGLWLLKNPDKIKDVFQQCLTEKKHMKHLIPFMCRLLNERSPSLMKHLIPDQDLKNTSNFFMKELINTFLLCEEEEADTEDILFLCQCLYESQSPGACIDFLDKLKYRLELSEERLDPYLCCAVVYVVTQSKERKICLNLKDAMIPEQGMRQLFGCLKNVEWVEPAGVRWLTPGLRKYSCQLTIDTNTVNTNLQLSDNNRKVTGVDEVHSYPDHPDRFDIRPELLCKDGLIGRCYWEVEWKGNVHISVSYRGIGRKGDSTDCLFGFNNQSWSLRCSDDGPRHIWHNNKSKSISSSPSISKRVAVYVDCPAGTLSYYIVSSHTLIHLHTFNTTFTDPLYPGFYVWPGASVSLCKVE